MTIRQRTVRYAAMGVAAGAALFATFAAVSAQVVDPSELDHLKCYRINDSLRPTRYLADLRNQFGLEPGCVVMTPARVLCVETEKTIISSPAPPGGGPSGDPAGHFLCYFVTCKENEAPSTVNIEDQFGRRRVTVDKARLLCAPANKLICGDGEIDAGEACDPGSAATNVCPDGLPCNADCTCAPGVCCQCPDTCTDVTGTICPAGCSPVVGGTCSAAGDCETCPCGQVCTDDAGNVGICREPAGGGPCECFVEEPGCVCGDACETRVGPGHCRPVGSTNQCECRPDELPNCPCGATCTVGGVAGICRDGDDNDGECKCRPVDSGCPCGERCRSPLGPGHCQPTNDSSVCECRPDEPPDCPCGTVCTADDGTVGVCRETGSSGKCKCRPEVPDCPCGQSCQDENGSNGICRHLPGTPSGVCTCLVPPPDDCPCGADCVASTGLVGKCRPVPGAPGDCACVSPSNQGHNRGENRAMRLRD